MEEVGRTSRKAERVNTMMNEDAVEAQVKNKTRRLALVDICTSKGAWMVSDVTSQFWTYLPRSF